jgi:hypothetical protein
LRAVAKEANRGRRQVIRRRKHIDQSFR